MKNELEEESGCHSGRLKINRRKLKFVVEKFYEEVNIIQNIFKNKILLYLNLLYLTFLLEHINS